jgi:ADP-ribosyl-[dinitrogen reductase] hydrolase
MNATESLSIQLLTEKALLACDQPTERVLEVKLTAPSSAKDDKRLPLNLALVLDRSGSMQGDKLVYVKQAAEYVLDLLEETDRVSLVIYDDKVNVLAESTPVTAQARKDLKHRLAGVRSGGMTDLSGGWLKGCQQVAQQQSDDNGQVNRALLLTDGLANVGITGIEELGVHARELVERGVSTSTFGVGEGFNEQLLEVMAENGGGNFTYIVSPVDIPDIFAREFSELMAITARDVEVELRTPAGVEINILGGWRTEKIGEGVTRISIGSLGSAQEKSIYIDLKFPAGKEGQQHPIEVITRGKSEAGQVLEQRSSLVFSYASQGELDTASTDEAVLERAALARISTVTRQALELERKGQAERAAKMLQDAIDRDTRYMDKAQKRSSEQTVRRMKHGMGESDRKQAHYQSYLASKQRVDPHFQARTQLAGQRSIVLLDQLLRESTVRIHDDRFLQMPPQGLTTDFTFDKVEGMLLGLAIGDALGNTSEGLLPAARRQRFGDVTNYLSHPAAGGQVGGLPSDDTQLAYWTLEVLLDAGELDPERLAWRFTRERIFGIGATVREFIRMYKDERRGWKRSGRESAGNGALMRIAPVLLPHLRRPTPGLWADAILAGMITHNDYASNAACVAFVAMLWDLLCRHTAPAPDWWAEAYHQVAAPLEGKTSYTPQMPGLTYRGSIANFVQQEVGRALASNWTVEQAGKTWGSGAYLLETLPSALYILARYSGDPEQAILRAVNDTRDNDSIAAIVGAAVGALHGKSALPERWISGLLGRTKRAQRRARLLADRAIQKAFLGR